MLTGPTDLSVELAERLVSLRPGADWALMAKNGTDVTSLARTVARASTGKQFILREHSQPSFSSSSPSAPVAAAYHGASNVWARGSPGVLAPEGAAFEAGFTYNDLASVEVALTQGKAAGDVAAIFVGGCSYMYSKPTVEPTPDFAKGLRELADRHGCLLVVDEIRTNFRVGRSLQGHWADLLSGNNLLQRHFKFECISPCCLIITIIAISMRSNFSESLTLFQMILALGRLIHQQLLLQKRLRAWLLICIASAKHWPTAIHWLP